MASSSLPSNVHVSSHPCLKAKLSLLRSQSTHARDTKQLVHEIATIIGCEALAHGLEVTESGSVSSPSSRAAHANATYSINATSAQYHY
jgi:uracil phosphoribosyltransferase